MGKADASEETHMQDTGDADFGNMAEVGQDPPPTIQLINGGGDGDKDDGF
eukprot:NODE_10800_length_191_cov_10.176056_g10717_i0.p1 GENE.NODE_10800_length_191_cov_10.176056_g10717_i0~~NODE_10800_length_191_cov_10.176056_g10717_i0.p1  ORF type:complete len:57 (-),score=23.63 NODE_10800_length_191_cov_10.176056_g10717_i0:19-168(-)